MKMTHNVAVNLKDESKQKNMADFSGQTVHAVAGIGHPQRFFQQLQQQGLQLICHAFDDHHRYRQHELMFQDDLPILMTEKDAVKCRAFATSNIWYIPLLVTISDELGSLLIKKLKEVKHG